MTCLSVSCWLPGSTSNGLQVPYIISNVRNNMLTLTKLYLNKHECIPKWNLSICTWLASRISLQVPDIIWHKNWNLDPNKNQKLASKISHIYCIGIKIYQKNSYIPYEIGILVCLLVILWSLANEYHIFVVLKWSDRYSKPSIYNIKKHNQQKDGHTSFKIFLFLAQET